MQPWLDWLDYFGADGLGRLTGLWLKFCLSLPRRLVHLLGRLCKNNPLPGQPVLQHEGRGQPSPRKGLSLGKLRRIVISTAVTLLVWGVATWKPLWAALGPGGERILAAILLLVSASWVISLAWICFSKTQPRGTAFTNGFQRRLH